MGKWLRRLSTVLAMGGLLLALIWGALASHGGRSVPAPSLTERRQAYQQAVNWFKNHEAEVMDDGNAALWWMLRLAAERQDDAYLKGLVQRSISQIYVDRNARMPWRRMVEPHAAVVHDPALTVGLTPYQSFFYHAVTCAPVAMDAGAQTTAQFLAENACRPMATKVFGRDNVCSTHQLMGVELVRQMGCAVTPETKRVRAELLSDVQLQMQLDPLFKDAYIQRVLMLYWLSGPQAVKPIWLQQVFAQQRSDGGWSGDRVFQIAPSWFQPWVFRQVWHKFWPSNFPPKEPQSDFHATAQGLLLAALSLQDPDAQMAP